VDCLAPDVEDALWGTATALAEAGPEAISQKAKREFDMVALAVHRSREGLDQANPPAQGTSEQVSFVPQGPSIFSQVMLQTGGNRHIQPVEGEQPGASGSAASAAASSPPPTQASSQDRHAQASAAGTSAPKSASPLENTGSEVRATTPGLSPARLEASKVPGAYFDQDRLFVPHDHGLVEFFSPDPVGGYDDLGPGAAAEAAEATTSPADVAEESQEATESEEADELLMEGPPPVLTRPPNVPRLPLPLPQVGETAARAPTDRSEGPELLPPGAVLTEIDRPQDAHDSLA
jgi:hypothetical protein